MTIAIASGKGGTGKTTVSVALAQALSQHNQVHFLDCDVEEPNAHLFIRPVAPSTRMIANLVPQVDPAACTGCGSCASHCQFNAIAIAGTVAMIFPELCHSCGRCLRHCPSLALAEMPVPIGIIDESRCGSLHFAWGTLGIGQTMSPPLIRELKKLSESEGFTLIDCPPGTSCAMVGAIRDSDFVLLVTEPTPFGLNDLQLAVETVQELGIVHGVIINRSGSNDRLIEDYCAVAHIPVFLKIAEDRRVAEGISRGQSLLDVRPEMAEQLRAMISRISSNWGKVAS